MSFKALLSLLVIGVLFVSIFSPWVEASVIYGPSKYPGDWYLGSGNVCNGSSNSKDPIANGSKQNGSLPHVNGNKPVPDIPYYSNQFPVCNRSAFDDYKDLMGRYRPDMHFDATGGIHLNAINSHDDGGSSLVFRFLSKYVQSSNFTINAPHGNYTLYLRNGDGTGKYVRNGTIFYVRLNGKDVFTPLDDSFTNQVLKKNVTLSIQKNDTLQVFAIGAPGSYMTLWLEDESPDIVLTSPLEDAVTNGTIILAGYTTDRNVTSINIAQNNNTTITTIPVSNGNFSTSLWIHAPVQLNVSAIDSTGTLRTTVLDLDGDMLPEKAELQFGFDPLNPDSDSKLTAVNESGNGIPDGQEILNQQGGEKLPNSIKYLLGADPFKVDSNGNGLTDYFEFMALRDVNVSSNSSEEMALPNEDPDHDGLTNIQEQALGTFPYVTDSDDDGLNDGYEVNISHTNPLLKDSDTDGLTDDSELKLGTDPNNPYSHGDGILDGLETYTTTASNDTLGINVSINGIGDMSKRVRIVQETSGYYTNNSALVSPLVNVEANGSFNYAIITIAYNQSTADPANLSLCYYNETYGLFLPVNSTVDPVNHTISANVTHLSMWGIFDLNALSDLYSTVATFNDEIAGYVNSSASIAKNVVDTGTALLNVVKTYTVDAGTNSVVIKDSVSFPNTRTTVQGASPTPSPVPSPSPGPLDYSPVVITMNDKGATNWFGKGASFPAGVYQINATGWYTHWYPVPSGGPVCIDLGPDPATTHSPAVCMYAWSSRGYNYPYANVSDKDRLGMHVKYGSNDSPVVALRIEPGTLQLNSSGGPIGMWDNDDHYEDNTYQLNYTLSYVGQSAPSLDMTDTDGDGLPDHLETHGWMDTQGNVYYTKPDKKDTDNDTLTDSQEAGTWTQLYQMKYFQVKSDPTKIDSDDDGLTDLEEAQVDPKPTNALEKDSDHDGLTDEEEVYGWYDLVLHAPPNWWSDPKNNPLTISYQNVNFGTNPWSNDTDQDGYSDYSETKGNFIDYVEKNGDGMADSGTVKRIYVYNPCIKEDYPHISYDVAYNDAYIHGYNSESPYVNNPYYIYGCEEHNRAFGYTDWIGSTTEVIVGNVVIGGALYLLEDFLEEGTAEYTPLVTVEETLPAGAYVAEVEAISEGESRDPGLIIGEQTGKIQGESGLASYLKNELKVQEGSGEKDIYQALIDKGFTAPNIATLTKLLGKDRVIRLNQVLDEYGIKSSRIQFIDDQITKNIDDKGNIRTTLSLNLYKMTEENQQDNVIQGGLNNVEGAYSEWRCYVRNGANGEYIVGLHKVNANGVDMIQITNSGKTLTIYEVKTGPVTVSSLTDGSFFLKDPMSKELILDPATGEKYYNAEGAINQIARNLKQKDQEKGNPLLEADQYRINAEEIWESCDDKELTFNINNENSNQYCNNLQNALGNSIKYRYYSTIDKTIKTDYIPIKYDPTNE